MSDDDDFVRDVEAIVAPYLSQRGFLPDGAQTIVDDGGRRGVAVFFLADDCKLQIYRSERGGEINAMIAPLDAPKEHGYYDTSGKWTNVASFSEELEMPLAELIRLDDEERARGTFDSQSRWLEWLRRRIAKELESARIGVVGESRSHTGRPLDEESPPKAAERTAWSSVRVDQVGLKSRHAKLLTTEPTDDAGWLANFPAGTREVVILDDTPGPTLTLRVHPVDDPVRIAFVRYDQLAVEPKSGE